MSDQSQLLQNAFLNTLRKDRVPVSVFLVNGIRLGGHIQSFDQYSIRLQGATPQLILKRVVATVVPEKFARAGKPPEGPRPRVLRKPPAKPLERP
jgi:host factor-I protein